MNSIYEKLLLIFGHILLSMPILNQIDSPIKGYRFFESYNAFTLLTNLHPDAYDNILSILNEFNIDANEIVSGGKNQSSITINLSNLFINHKWIKEAIGLNEQKITLFSKSDGYLDEVTLDAATHKVDFIKKFKSGYIGIDIEWNSKDTSFDRDLTNFQWLYQFGLINFGIIITRAIYKSDCETVLKKHYEKFMPYLPEDLPKLVNYTVTSRSVKQIIKKSVKYSVPEATAKVLASSKYGTTTTNFKKLRDKMNQGKAGFCPIFVITIEPERIEI